MLVLALGQLLAPVLDSDGPLAGVLRATGLALAVALAFFVLEAGAHELLYGTVPDLAGRGAVQLGLLAVLLVAFAGVVLLQVLEPTRPSTRRRRAWAIHLRNGLYANAVLDRLVGGLRVPRADGPRH
jgi:NAD(P)H-quinone oxidoreductase subunit 5